MEHFKWKRRKYNVMKKKTISSIKYICHNKQLKNLHKIMPMNISQQIITFNIQKKTPDSDIFQFVFFSIFELRITVFDYIYAYLILQSAVVFPAQGLSKKILIGYNLFVHNYHVLKFENNLQILIFFMFFSIFVLKIRVFDELYDY